MKQPELKTLIKNDRVDHFLLIRRIELRSTKNDRDFLSTELGDKSTSMNANIWEGFAEIAAKGKVGDVVKVTGTIEEFQGSLQIRVSSIRLAVEKDKVFPKDFLPHSKRNPEEMKKNSIKRLKIFPTNILINCYQKFLAESGLNFFQQHPQENPGIMLISMV